MKTLLAQDTAILLFANSAMEDARLKKMSGEPKILERLTEHTLQIIEATGLPFFHFSEKEQKGANFAERFTNAIQEVVNLGYNKIITVGNDSPNLSHTHLEKAMFSLSTGNSAVGPSRDGGCYLIALQAKDFQAEDFAALPWQTSSLLHELTDFLSSNTSVEQLGLLYDIDSFSDIKRLSNFLKGIHLKWIQLFSRLYSSHGPILYESVGVPQYHYFKIPFNKGSPFCFAKLYV
nr:DUF2064 domain-containing protein [Allomuricauda sp.]